MPNIDDQLYDDLVKVLEARMFIYTDDDEDNDYEVIGVLDRLRECGPVQPQEALPVDNRTPQQLRDAGRPYCPKCYTFGDFHRSGCINQYQGREKHISTPKEMPNAD